MVGQVQQSGTCLRRVNLVSVTCASADAIQRKGTGTKKVLSRHLHSCGHGVKSSGSSNGCGRRRCSPVPIKILRAGGRIINSTAWQLCHTSQQKTKSEWASRVPDTVSAQAYTFTQQQPNSTSELGCCKSAGPKCRRENVVQSLQCTLQVLPGMLQKRAHNAPVYEVGLAAAERVKVVVRVRPPKTNEAGGAVRVGPDHRGIVLARE